MVAKPQDFCDAVGLISQHADPESPHKAVVYPSGLSTLRRTSTQTLLALAGAFETPTVIMVLHVRSL